MYEILTWVSLLVTPLGLVIAIWQAIQAKSAAQSAEMATQKLRSEIARERILSDLSSVLDIMQEVKVLLRTQHRDALLRASDRSLSASIMLRMAHARYPGQFAGDKIRLLKASEHLVIIETEVSGGLVAEDRIGNMDLERLSILLSEQIGNVAEVLTHLDQRYGG